MLGISGALLVMPHPDRQAGEKKVISPCASEANVPDEFCCA
jgi:hypothetical protein